MKLIKFLSIVLILAIPISILGVIPASAKNITIKDIAATDSSYEMVQWAVDQGYMSLTLGKFLPAKYVKRGEFAAIVVKLTGSGKALQSPKKPTFQDVTIKDQFYKQIETAKLYMTSFQTKTAKIFKPNSYITREDAMYSIVKVLGYDLDEALGSNETTDLSLEEFIEDAGSVSPAVVRYISAGISNELMDLRTVEDKLYFDPRKNTTRMDLAKLIYNAYQKKDYTVEETVIENSDDSNKSNNNNSSTNNVGSSPMKGTVEKLDEPLIYVNSRLSYDSIWITKIQPLGKLEDGKETTIIIEAEYSLVTQDKAKFSVWFNNSETNTWKSSKELRENAVLEVPKGVGKYRFTIPVKVKKWDDVTPFYFTMRLLKDYNALFGTADQYLKLG